MAVHPLARGRGGLLDTAPVFVRFGRHRNREQPLPLSVCEPGTPVRNGGVCSQHS